MKSEKIKFAGPSKKMAKALENEGLRVYWPKSSVDSEELAIDATFYTGNDWEKSVLIDLRDKVVDTKGSVDNAIASELREEYDNFDFDEKVAINLEGSETERRARGVPDAARLVEDIKEQEKKLKRFTEVAEAVAEGREIPAESDSEEVKISGSDAKRVADILEKVANYTFTELFTHEENAFAKMICDELRNKVREG